MENTLRNNTSCFYLECSKIYCESQKSSHQGQLNALLSLFYVTIPFILLSNGLFVYSLCSVKQTIRFTRAEKMMLLNSFVDSMIAVTFCPTSILATNTETMAAT